VTVNWTDYPARVATVGDLVSVLETLDRTDAENGFAGDLFQRESAESAYFVDLFPTGYRFNPRLDRMPGLERLLDRFGLDDSFTLTQIRELRRLSARSRNYYRQSLITFANWCVQTSRLGGHKLDRVPKAHERTDPRRQRRALTEEELRRLLAVAVVRPLTDARTVRRGKRKGEAYAELRADTVSRLNAIGREGL
jgi:hypothetical protein